jgi:small subunit ribosomal protein S16
MLSLRLSRIGKKKQPIYSLIVVEKTKDPWGDYTEKVGTYNPHNKEIKLNLDRIKYWLSVGAQPTATAHNLLVSQNVITGEKVRAGKSQPGKKRLAEIASAKKAEEDAKAKAEADKLAAEEAAKAPVEVPAETVETPVEEVKAE